MSWKVYERMENDVKKVKLDSYSNADDLIDPVLSLII